MVINKLSDETDMTKKKLDLELQRKVRSIENKYEDNLRQAREAEVNIGFILYYFFEHLCVYIFYSLYFVINFIKIIFKTVCMDAKIHGFGGKT